MLTSQQAGRLGVVLVGLIVAAAVATVAAATGTSVVVSGNPSPFATPGCAAIDNAQTSQVAGIYNYLNTEVEPWVAVDPTDGNHLVGSWQQDRWNDGGANGLASAYSTNGGANWTDVALPFTACAGPGSLDYQRASDPWVSIGPGKPASYGCAPTAKDCSTVYQIAIPFDETTKRTAVAASVSYDGGAHYTNTQTLIADPSCSGVKTPGYVCNNTKSFVLDDKESITADPTQPGYAYAVWDRLVAPPASFPGFLHEPAYKGPAFISRTTDYGQTWSAPQQIVSTPSIDQTIGNVIVVDPRDGTLYDFFVYLQNSNNGGNRGASIGFVKSTDHGMTWGRRHTVASSNAPTLTDANNIDPRTNTPPAPLRTADGLPQPVIGKNGQLYVVWEDVDPAVGTNQAFITTSSDGGVNWSTRSIVNANTSQPAYTPSVAIAPNGTVGVTYYQWDQPTSSGLERTVLYIQKSTSAGNSSTAPTFGPRTAVSGEFNGLAAPFAEGYFLGDYEGLAANANGFIPFNVLTNCDDASCLALTSVTNPANLTPTNKNATDVYAFPGS